VYQNKQELIVNSEMNQVIDELKIYNIVGSLVKTIKKPDLIAIGFNISTQDFHSGVYLVQVISGNQKFSKKIIIQ
jgi:fibronectin type 3 domain-containing protein